MAALTLPRFPAIVRPLQTETWTPAEPQGKEDMQLRAAAGAALLHLQQRSEYLLSAGQAGEDYNSVPLTRAFTVRITYRNVGTLQPIPYALDE